MTANSMQKFIESELSRNPREKVGYRVFCRETKTFYENSPEMSLTLAGEGVLQINDQSVPQKNIVIQRYAGVKDRNDRKIYEGDYLLTNEGNWRGFVIFHHGSFMIVDPDGGYSAEPEWDKCEIISNIGEMDGNVHKWIQREKAQCQGDSQDENSTPVVRFFDVPR